MPSLMIVSNSAITCSCFVLLRFVPTLARFGHNFNGPFTAFAPGARFVIAAAGAENGAGASRLLPASGVSGSSMLAAVAKQMARRRISAPSILEGDPAVHGDRTITFGTLHAPPLTTREVAHNLHRLDRELVEIVDHDIGPIALDQ